MAFVQPDTGGTGDALEHQGGFPALTAITCGHDELLLHAGVIKQLELAELLGYQGTAAFRRRGITVMVVGPQAALDDRTGYGLAAGTAGGFFSPFKGDGVMRTRRDIQPAVEAAGRTLGRCRGLRVGRERHGEEGGG